MRRSRLLLALLSALPAWGSVPAPAQDGDDGPRLLRCAARAPTPCVRSFVVIRPEEAHALSSARPEHALSSARPEGVGEEWSGRLGRRELSRGYARTPLATYPPLRLLVLVDVSGSMAESGLQTTRSALRLFLSELPRDSVRVAVAPFSSLRVSERIREASFAPPAEASVRVERLPRPEGNTGLYTAVQAGLGSVAGAVREAGGRAWGAVLVITDGKNDIGPGDDPGLLSGEEGRREVVESIRRSGAYMFIVGIGAAPDTVELKALAGTRGEHFLVAEDPVSLQRAFSRIQGWILDSRELVFPVPGGVESLASGALPFSAWAGRDRPGPGAVHGGTWRPPLFALPAFQGVVDPAGAPEWLARPLFTGDPWLLRRMAILAFFSGLFLILWVAVPRLLWPVPVHAGVPLAAVDPPRGGEAPPVRIRLARTGQAATLLPHPPPQEGGLRRDLREAPPRRPTDVTASVARRVVHSR
ncbi:MAG TPA: vWA domain-containing protein [Longimicrobiaceae bacterium]|nr:vWA domain-containing protein [Longimicrobiaceae bacterium]